VTLDADGSQLPSLQPVDTTTAAFVGEHPSGRLDCPVLVTNARDLKRSFGSARGRLVTAAQHFFANGGTRLYLLPVADFERDPEAALARLDEIDDFSLLASPGHGIGAVVEAGGRYCERRANCFYLADSPADAGPVEVRSLVEGLGARSSYAANYVPWLNPDSPAPASGFVAGVLARNPVWHVPPGAALRGATALAHSLSDSDRDSRDALGVNALLTPRTGEVAVGSSQTLAPPTETESKYVSVRRMFTFLEHSIDKGTQWAIFEPNAEPLWSKLRRSIGAFLETQWRSGAFQGAVADEAYFVRCDRTTMTQDDIDSGIVNVVVGIAPLKPAEFVILRFGLKAARDDPDP
jgi:uncharacterized protein